MQVTVLLSALVLSGLAMGMVVTAVDWHWPALVVLCAMFLGCVFRIGPRVYALEGRAHNKVRLHRPIGVVDLDLSTVEVVRRRMGVGVRAKGNTYLLFRGVGSASVVDEWLRRVAR